MNPSTVYSLRFPLLLCILFQLTPLSLSHRAAPSSFQDCEEDDPVNDLGIALAMTPAIGHALRRRRGRPRKFAGPSRAVTLTLPEEVLQRLSAINPDLSRAVVHLTSRNGSGTDRPPAELSVFGKRAVITVRPTPSLARRIGIDLVPLPDGRALISFGQPQSIADLELVLLDALEDKTLPEDDRAVFKAISDILTNARRSSDIELLRQSIIVLDSSGARRKSPRRRSGTPARKDRGGPRSA